MLQLYTTTTRADSECLFGSILKKMGLCKRKHFYVCFFMILVHASTYFKGNNSVYLENVMCFYFSAVLEKTLLEKSRIVSLSRNER